MDCELTRTEETFCGFAFTWLPGFSRVLSSPWGCCELFTKEWVIWPNFPAQAGSSQSIPDGTWLHTVVKYFQWGRLHNLSQSAPHFSFSYPGGTSCVSISAHCLSSWCLKPLRETWLHPLDALFLCFLKSEKKEVAILHSLLLVCLGN